MAMTMSGVSLNDNFLIGPMLHPQLIDVLIQFQSHKVALPVDMSQMYRVVLLPEEQWHLHQFVWRKDLLQHLKDYRMSRLTFGICTSSFASNMVMKQNATDHMTSHPEPHKLHSIHSMWMTV